MSNNSLYKWMGIFISLTVISFSIFSTTQSICSSNALDASSRANSYMILINGKMLIGNMYLSTAQFELSRAVSVQTLATMQLILWSETHDSEITSKIENYLKDAGNYLEDAEESLENASNTLTGISFTYVSATLEDASNWRNKSVLASQPMFLSLLAVVLGSIMFILVFERIQKILFFIAIWLLASAWLIWVLHGLYGVFF